MKKIYFLIGALLTCAMLTGCGGRLMVANIPPDGISMENTILGGEKILINRDAYKYGTPERYDIIAFDYPDDRSDMFIQRIIGLPGETVDIRAGKVYIDGSDTPLDDSFCPEEALGDFGPYIVPEDSYFMLGDNRNYSKDSRFWENQYVSIRAIVGKAELD